MVIGAAKAVKALAAEMIDALMAVQEDRNGSLIQNSEVLGRSILHPVHQADLLASQMLAYAGAQPLAPAKVELPPFLSDLAHRLRQTLDSRIHVLVNVGDDCPPCRADPHALGDALLNLVINSRDAMIEGGHLQLSANVVTCEDGSAAVAVSVADDGVAMTADFCDRAMHPFVTTKKNNALAGMGLPAADGFARQSGGRLVLSCRAGGGVTATLILPQAAPEASAREPRAGPSRHFRKPAR